MNDILKVLEQSLLDLSYLDKDDHAVKYVTKQIEWLKKYIQHEFVYIKYKVSLHDEWEYYKFIKSDFDCLEHDDIEERIFSEPEWSWVYDSYRSYSIEYEICTSDEYHNVKGF